MLNTGDHMSRFDCTCIIIHRSLIQVRLVKLYDTFLLNNFLFGIKNIIGIHLALKMAQAKLCKRGYLPSPPPPPPPKKKEKKKKICLMYSDNMS